MVRSALTASLLLVMGLLAGPAMAAGRHADPELESILPTTLGGVALTVESQAGPELATRSAAFDAFLAELGRTRADFTLASAYSQGDLPAEVGAWRVKGADPARMLPAFQAAVQKSSAVPLTTAEEDGGGARSSCGSAIPVRWPAVRSTPMCAATWSSSCRRRGPSSRKKRWPSCRPEASIGSGDVKALAPVHRQDHAGDDRDFHGSSGACAQSSALTMKPASTSSVAEVT